MMLFPMWRMEREDRVWNDGRRGGGLTKVILFPRAKPYSLSACRFRQLGIQFNEIWKLCNCIATKLILHTKHGSVEKGSENSMKLDFQFKCVVIILANHVIVVI